MYGQPQATVKSFTSIKYLLSAALTVLMICFAGFNAAAQDKLEFKPEDTLDQIRAKIKHNGYNFTVGHTWVYDLPPEEQAKMFKPRPAPAPEKRIIAPNTDIILKATEPAQTSFDWRSYNGHSYIGPIRNQGKNGTCYAFGACAAAESTYNFKNGLYDLNCVDFAEMYIIWTLSSKKPYWGQFNINNNGSGAGPDYYELYALTKAGAPEGAAGFEGICSEADFPYSDSFIPPKPSVIEASKNFPRVTFKQWNRVFPTDYADTTEQIKTAISTYGAVDVEVTVDSAFLAYTSGIYENTDTQPDAVPYYYSDTGHCVSLVGWNDNPLDGGGGYWILRNEWGPSWGENGYMRIRYFSAKVNTSAAYLEAGPTDSQYAIRGQIHGMGKGITISLTGAAASLTTTVPYGDGGEYVPAGLDDGAYTVTPTRPGYAFEPASREVTVSGKNVTGCDFIATQTGVVLTMAVPQANAGSTYPPAGNSAVPQGEWVYISAMPANAQNAFKGWSISGNAELQSSASSAVNMVMLSGNATVSATFVMLPPPETVTLSIGYIPTGCTTAPATGAYDVLYNDPVDIWATQGDGYFFKNWTISGVGTIQDPNQQATTVTLQGNAKVTPIFSKQTEELEIDVDPANSGSTNPAAGVYTVAYGTVEIQAFPANGYYFAKWTADGSTGNIRIKDIYNASTSADITFAGRLTANFQRIDKTAILTVGVSADNSGSTNPGAGAHTVAVGGYINIAAIPANGYYFTKWTVTGSAKIKDPYNTMTSVVLAGDATVTANFMPIVTTATLTMAVGADEYGSTTNPGEGEHVVAAGDRVQIEAFPADGFFFANWSVIGNAQIEDVDAETTSVTLSGNATVTANFSPVAPGRGGQP